MADEKICKTKDCENHVIDGKFCMSCTQKRKERRNLVLGISGSIVSTGTWIAHKTGLLKKIPGAILQVTRLLK